MQREESNTAKWCCVLAPLCLFVLVLCVGLAVRVDVKGKILKVSIHMFCKTLFLLKT